MGNFTPEQVQECVVMAEQHWPGSHVAGMLRDYAATLRRQAGRVDEGMVERAEAARWGYYETGRDSDPNKMAHEAMRAALTAALAQNTQGEAVPEGFRPIAEVIAEHEKDPSRAAALAEARADLHAERARVPADTGPFADWLAREMPPGTVISNPAWWAPRILRQIAYIAAAPSQRAEVK